MLKIWEVSYKGHVVRVENTWFKGERLFVDGRLQDEQIGFDSRCRLYGRITNELGETEKIKVSIGGWFSVCCRIFIADQLIFTDNKYC